jgi:hypothetical protein
MNSPSSYGEVFAYMVAIPGLLFAIGMAALAGGTVGSWVIAGALFGLFIALFGAKKLVGETCVIRRSDSDKDAFVSRLNVTCLQFGYEPDKRVDDFLTYGPNEKSSYAIGPIKLAPARFLRLGVQLEPGQATFVGPRSLLARLREKLA